MMRPIDRVSAIQESPIRDWIFDIIHGASVLLAENACSRNRQDEDTDTYGFRGERLSKGADTRSGRSIAQGHGYPNTKCNRGRQRV